MEETYLGYRLLLLAMIIGMNAFFASAEMALVSARPSRLREMADGGNVGAQAALNLLGRPERLLSTVQVGVTLAGLGAGWAGEETVYGLLISALQPIMTPQTQTALHAFSFVVAFLTLTFLMVVLGEVTPKNLGIKQAERYAVVVAPILLVFYRISEPFIYVLERASAVVSRALGMREGERGAGHSTEELKLIASSLRAADRMPPFVEQGLERLLDLPQISVREVMVPRNSMITIPAGASLDQVLRTVVDSPYSRFPVYEDEPQRIVGILHIKDLLPQFHRARLAARLNAAPPPFRLAALLHKHLVVPESKPLGQIVDEFRQNHVHMALVVDEFGTITGLLTLEDALEQIFGEIEDEHDPRRPLLPPEQATLELDGSVSIRDLEAQYGLELPTNAGFETLAGFLLFQLGYIPKTGESVAYEDRRFTILEMDNKRIARVRIERVE